MNAKERQELSKKCADPDYELKIKSYSKGIGEWSEPRMSGLKKIRERPCIICEQESLAWEWSAQVGVFLEPNDHLMRTAWPPVCVYCARANDATLAKVLDMHAKIERAKDGILDHAVALVMKDAVRG